MGGGVPAGSSTRIRNIAWSGSDEDERQSIIYGGLMIYLDDRISDEIARLKDENRILRIQRESREYNEYAEIRKGSTMSGEDEDDDG